MSKFKFRDKIKKISIAKQAALERMGNNAVQYFKVDTFDKASFDGDKWKERKSPDSSRQMLVKTGRMRQDIRITERGLSHRRVGTTVPYAKFHNEGTDRMPQRKFIGASRWLYRRNGVEILRALKSVFETGKQHAGNMPIPKGTKIHTGSRGGRYYLAGSGNKVYVKR